MASIPQEIHYLSALACVPCREWRHQIIAANFEDDNVATPQTVFTFTVPAQSIWIVTEISLEQFNPSPVGTGDFRSEQVDYNGLTNAWITVNSNPIMAADSIASSALFNRPVLLAFQSGTIVKIIIQRDAASLPTDEFQIQLAINGYFAPLSAYALLSLNTTNIQQP